MTPPAPAASSGDGFKKFAGDHRTQLIVGVVAAGAGLYALKKNSSSSSTTGTTSTTGTVPAGGYSSDPYNAAQDAYNSLEPQLAALQQQLSTVTAGSASPAPTSPTAGFTTQPVTPGTAAKAGTAKPVAPGPQYSLLSGPEAQALLKAGGKLYYNPTVRSGAGNVPIGSNIQVWKAGVSNVNLYKKNY